LPCSTARTIKGYEQEHDAQGQMWKRSYKERVKFLAEIEVVVISEILQQGFSYPNKVFATQPGLLAEFWAPNLFGKSMDQVLAKVSNEFNATEIHRFMQSERNS